MALLVWIPSKKVFLIVREGTVENLTRKDWRNGYVYVVSWSMFRPEDIDMDDELEMHLIDGGFVTYKEKLTEDNFEQEALLGVYRNAIGSRFVADDAIVLMKDYGEER